MREYDAVIQDQLDKGIIERKAAKHLTLGQEKRIISHITASSVETKRQQNSGWCMMPQLRRMETHL